MSERKDLLGEVEKVVIKVGTSSITRGGDGVSSEFMDSIAAQIRVLKDAGMQVLLVTSGAIGIGMKAMNAHPKPNEIPIRSAAASVGQSILMQRWNESFSKQGLVAAQILLTMDFYSDRESYLNLNNTISTLLDHGVVPVFNENDAICTKEIDAMFGDNDTLSAMIASKMDADLLVILSDVEGLFDRNPKIDPGARLIPTVRDIDAVEGSAGDPTTRVGTGGMKTKIKAARICKDAGCSMIIASSATEDAVVRAAEGDDVGTIFVTDTILGKKRRWVKAAHPAGRIVVDEGAEKAIMSHRSLLPIGIREVSGVFDVGDVVEIVCGGRVFAKGITDYSYADVARVRGLHSDKAIDILGRKNRPDVIRSENIVTSL
jgi:glutamate 5-kinase